MLRASQALNSSGIFFFLLPIYCEAELFKYRESVLICREKDGLDVRPESHPRYIFATSATTGRATLTIPVVEKDDAGLYSCVAHNSVGRDRCACLIYVDGSGVQQRKATSSAAGSTLDTDKLPPEPSKPQTVAPSGKIEVVTDLPKVIEITEGEELRLFCVVRSDTHLIRKSTYVDLVSTSEISTCFLSISLNHFSYLDKGRSNTNLRWSSTHHSQSEW